jgi:phosphoribosylglycinamide formyltransferase-1
VTTLSRVRTAVLVSGRGSNLAALIEAARDPGYPAGIVLVASNRPGAPGLERAREAGIPAITVDHQAFTDRESFERALDAALRAHRVELLALAGFMRVLTPWFIEAWRDRMVNIHPSLLPAFRGLHTHQRALEEGVLLHGCTVHRVVPDLDAGPILGQAAVPVLPGDDAGRLAARVLAAEHRLYPACLAVVARRLRGDPAGVERDDDPSATLVNVGH